MSSEIAVTTPLCEEYPRFCQVPSIDIPHSPVSLLHISLTFMALVSMLSLAHCFTMGKNLLFFIFVQLSRLGGAGILKILLNVTIELCPLPIPGLLGH